MTYKIGLAGRAGSGKSTIAKMLTRELDAEIVPLAAKIKDIAVQMGWNGVKDDKGRRLLQLLGTECGRDCIGENCWVDMWVQEANLWNVDFVIADDVRFDNEAKACDIVIRVTGRNNGTSQEHASEKGVSDDLIDLEICNVKDLQAMETDIRALAFNLQYKRDCWCGLYTKENKCS